MPTRGADADPPVTPETQPMQPQERPDSADEAALVETLEFDAELVAKIRALGTACRQLIGVDEEYDEAPAQGLVLETRPDHGRKTLDLVREVLHGSGYRAYLYDESFGHGPDQIAVVRSTDPYLYLSIVRTDGVNYDIEHEEVLRRYKAWDEEFGLSLVGAGRDWLEAKMGRPPGDWAKFAEEIHEFCPDVVDQGVGDVNALAETMRKSNVLYLWWD